MTVASFLYKLKMKRPAFPINPSILETRQLQSPVVIVKWLSKVYEGQIGTFIRIYSPFKVLLKNKNSPTRVSCGSVIIKI